MRHAALPRRTTRTVLPALLLLAAAGAAAASELPKGFGGIDVGDSWNDIQARFHFRNLAGIVSPWDRYVSECGYRAVQLDAKNGVINVTANDFVVTEVSLTTPIKSGSDVLGVADLVMQTYGQPDAASMRNQLGAVTITRDDVNYVTLDYHSPREVRFTISGRDLWRYQVRVLFQQHRWHENKTLQCARAKDRQASNN